MRHRMRHFRRHRNITDASKYVIFESDVGQEPHPEGLGCPTIRPPAWLPMAGINYGLVEYLFIKTVLCCLARLQVHRYVRFCCSGLGCWRKLHAPNVKNISRRNSADAHRIGCHQTHKDAAVQTFVQIVISHASLLVDQQRYRCSGF